MGDPLGSSARYEVFWELTDFRFHRNSEVKRERGQSILRMDDSLESFVRMSFLKQNRESVISVQNGQISCYDGVEPEMW
ncbi:hypothetical protein DVH24_030260 [Malus domestica]|uniref:Uncharacterized protein n=1 Tax=Malus domestica TaxID=3750 RepID=A0A498K482_MALDO|nr:hypothetical protein DVH24_030260 [Malus domestica]